MRYIPFILLLICIGSCMYIQIAYKRPGTEITSTTIVNNATTTTVTTSSQCPTTTMNIKFPDYLIKHYCDNVTNVYNVTNIINITKYIPYNVSSLEKKQLLNLMARRCPTSGCAYGYYLCKEDALTIFNLPHSKFSEAPKTEYKLENKEAYNESLICFKDISDGKKTAYLINNTIWGIRNKGEIVEIAKIKRNTTTTTTTMPSISEDDWNDQLIHD